MKSTFLFISIVIVFISTTSLKAQDSLWVREYQFDIYNQYDLRNSSTNAISTHRVLSDLYRKNIVPKMNKKAGNITYDIYSFAVTFLTMLWSHEFGHSLRAKQVGGEFRIHNVSLPIPYTTMHLPPDINYVDEALSVTAGFEVNYLSVRKIQREFVAGNGAYNEDLAFSFANRILYPIYTTFITPIDPKEPDVWINTAGDPVHCVLPVFKNYSNNQVFMADSTVNPELVSFYNQSAIFGSFFRLVDPHFYREVGAAFGRRDKVRRPKFIIGNYENGWTYGTLFNTSPLGYELYINNYLHFKGNHFSFYAKYGNPFKNNGAGVTWGNMIESPKLQVSAGLDIWNQDIFGTGVATEFEARVSVFKNVDLNMVVGYKTDGYVLGKQIDSGFNIGGGLIFRGNYF